MIESSQEITITRTFDAPRELVFAAFTEAKHLAHWFGPHGCSIGRCVSELWPGGRLEVDMRFGEGEAQTYTMTGEYIEVDPPNGYVLRTFGLLEGGARNTFTFADAGGKTELTLHVQALKMTDPEILRPFLEGMKDGSLQSYEKLDVYLASAV